jgi:hypothetical protein
MPFHQRWKSLQGTPNGALGERALPAWVFHGTRVLSETGRDDSPCRPRSFRRQRQKLFPPNYLQNNGGGGGGGEWRGARAVIDRLRRFPPTAGGSARTRPVMECGDLSPLSRRRFIAVCGMDALSSKNTPSEDVLKNPSAPVPLNDAGDKSPAPKAGLKSRTP